MNHRETRARLNLARKKCLGFVERFCAERGELLADVLGGARYPATVAARHELWSLLGDTLLMPNTEIGRLFAVDSSTVWKALEHRRAELARVYS